jgi:chemotaxis-related protein WspB
MLFLKFQIGDEACALDTSQIVEILPLMDITPIVRAPPGIAGLIDYRGVPVPVIDLSDLALGQPAQPHISTRLIVVRYAASRLLGLIAEQATDTLRAEAEDFVDTGIACDSAPYLGLVSRAGGRLIRWIEIQKLLPVALRDTLGWAVEQGAGSETPGDACPTTTLPRS